MTTLHLRLRSARGADATAVSLRAPGAITAASVQRQPIKVNGPRRNGDLKLSYVGLPHRRRVRAPIRGHGVLRANAVLGGQGDPGPRFRAVHDTVYRRDGLERAWELVRANKGAAGIDEQTIADVEQYGVSRPRIVIEPIFEADLLPCSGTLGSARFIDSWP